MALLIDSSVFIEAERRRLNLQVIVSLAAAEEPLAMAALSVSELLLGIHLAIPSPQRDRREAFVRDVIEEIPILDFDLGVARVYAEVWARLRLGGNVVAPQDLIIGATALMHGYDVLTHNVRDFDRIKGLSVRQPQW